MRTFACALAIAACTSVHAQDRRPAIINMTGVGQFSCGTYLESRRKNNDPQLALYQQWIAGYLVGVQDMVFKPGMTSTVNVDMTAYLPWLDKWCGDDPTSTVFAAVVALRNKLWLK